MPPEPAFIFGLIFGVIATLLVQAFGRRKARQAIASFDQQSRRDLTLLGSENARQTGQIDRLQERIAVLERITTDPAARTAREIDALR